ncbi:hypothetical protein HRbin36_00985 [bacterium HR36]|nr:hypothetical protein HRbin36_00985 [bacterium HR36]
MIFRRNWWAPVSLLILLLALLTGMVLLLRHEPSSFRRAAIPPSPQRSQLSAEFYRQISTLLSLLTDPEPDKPWQLRLRQEQINSYLAEGFVESSLDRTELPPGVRDPRVVLEPGLVRVSFRYGEGFWRVVVSLELRLWVSAAEPQVLLVQIRRVRMGAVPVPVRYVQELLAHVLRRRNLEIIWYRYEGLPVAAIRFQSSRRAPTFHFTNLRLEAGEILVQGRTLAAEN